MIINGEEDGFVCVCICIRGNVATYVPGCVVVSNCRHEFSNYLRV